MSGMLTAVDVESEIIRLSEKLEAETHALAVVAEEEARAEVAFKREFARRFLEASGPMEERRQKATLLAEPQLTSYRIRDAVHSSKQELLRTLRAQMDALRTIAANIRGVS
jgi:hypothetical protein